MKTLVLTFGMLAAITSYADTPMDHPDAAPLYHDPSGPGHDHPADAQQTGAAHINVGQPGIAGSDQSQMMSNGATGPATGDDALAPEPKVINSPRASEMGR